MTDSRKPEIARILTIAGSDSSGGAGVQADIKTACAFGVYASAAITAITAQNTKGVDKVEILGADMVEAQINSVLSDIGADIVKTGMLGNSDIIRAVAKCLEEDDTGLVLDPVMVATSGDRLLDESAVEILKSKLFPLADIVTPNIPEAEVLTGQKIKDSDDMIKAGRAILQMGAGAVLMKGGHLSGKTLIDILLDGDGENIMISPRIHTHNTHGTGCTLASAIASLLAKGYELSEAVIQAREFVHQAIKTAPKLGAGNGPLNHYIDLDIHLKNGKKDNNKKSPFAVLKDL